MTPWLLMDYGDVISRAYDDHAGAAVAGLLGLPRAELDRRYWEHRLAFDAGQDATEYWSTVADRSLAPDEVAALVSADLSGWARVDDEVLALLDEQAAAGVRLALLSNAPHFQADAFDELSWTDRFEHVFVSARLGLTKPDPAIFTHVLDELGAPAGDVTFVDDRAPNVAGARSVGMRGIVFESPAQLRAALGAPPPPAGV